MLAKVLVVDDDVTMTLMLANALRSGGFEVFVANSGRQGIAAARRHRPDVVVLDLNMPEVDGYQVCEAIRKVSQIPVLALSGVVDAELVGKILAKGATDYLIKPVPRGVLLAKLRHLTRAVPSTPKPLMQDAMVAVA